MLASVAAMATAATITRADALLAERALRIVCAALGTRAEDILPATQNQPRSRTAIRAIWCYCLSAYLSGPRIATIAHISLWTVRNDLRSIARAVELHDQFDDWLDDVARLIEPLPGLLSQADRFVAVLVESLAAGVKPRVVTAPRARRPASDEQARAA
ncbi:MAG: hypothetical protein KGL39_25315 [Patescibacteria group bacterium]|nr:hypothetical protein [Patescibacteria group bacterium]